MYYIKNNILKIKKYYFNLFLNKNYFKKQYYSQRIHDLLSL
jgi:hypothetical protein